MEKSITLTVFFDGQFYVGLIEKINKNKLSVARHVFGAEPKDSEVFEFINLNFARLKFSPQVAVEKKAVIRKNPKVRQRKIKSLLEQKKIGTKSQQAIKKMQEVHALERKANSKEKRELEQDERFALRQEKKKQKHSGH